MQDSFHSSGANSSYPFPNWTTGALMLKNCERISDRVMDSFLDICRHPSFKSRDVPVHSNGIEELYKVVPKLVVCQLRIGQTQTGKDINFYYTDPVQLIGSVLLSSKHVQK
eukprot:m.268321 g.268321  ORF g.268321 m.268321 type:complete len:111 (+) comp40526_c0_seq17:583-915(+)